VEKTFGKTGPLPSWLAEPEQEIVHQPVVPEPAAATEPDLPDWLQDQPGLATEEVPVQPAEEVETPPLPDWLQNIESENVEVPLPEAPVGSPAENPVQVDLSTEPDELIKQAQQALSGGQIDLALSAYNTLVQKDEQIEETIHDLKDALYRYPVESSIWQTLGDALIRANRVQDALDAYTKAEELLK
jgi:hypothetical protein